MHIVASEVEAAGRKLWGPPNETLSQRTKGELRFGKSGSKAVNVQKGIWKDHETDEGGGWIDLHVKAYGHKPPREGNGHDDTASDAKRDKLRAVGNWFYEDGDGTEVVRVTRYEPKTFRQFRSDGRGGWIAGLARFKPPLYQVPALRAADRLAPVYITEGEKHADALRGWELTATCNCMGADAGTGTKFRPDHADELAGRDVVILPDNDSAGRTHAAHVARLLTGKAARVRVLTLQDLPPKGDVLNWIAAGGTADELARLTALAPDADSWRADESRPDPESEPNPNWRALCMVNDKGALRVNVANALTALRRAPELHGLLKFDELRRYALLTRPVTGANGRPFTSRPVTDEDATLIQEAMQRLAFPSMAIATVHQAIGEVAREFSFNPVLDYLDGLTWDGTERLCSWVEKYLGALRTSPEIKEYHAKIGTMFLIAMVRRIYQPGCQSDYMLVLEGPQGAGKSRACRILGGAWFSENLPDLRNSKDVSQYIRGKWLVEVGELSAMSKADIASLKQFLTRTVEEYRPSYGRMQVYEPRSCLFVGTTNEKEYFRDWTGARRWWPVGTGDIELDGLAQDRDQLFAEAKVLHLAGEPSWPDRDFERKYIKPQQEARREADAWEAIIEAHLAARVDPIPLAEVFQKGLNLPAGQIDRDKQLRATRAMRLAGWEPGSDGMRRAWVKAPPKPKPKDPAP